MIPKIVSKNILIELLHSIEVASEIFRLLPAKYLLNVVSVCKRWKAICESDIKLRKRIRLQIRKVKNVRIAGIIRDDFNERRIPERPFFRTAMVNVSNFIKKSGLQFTFNHVVHGDKRKTQNLPYLGGSLGQQKRLSKPTICQRSCKRLRM